MVGELEEDSVVYAITQGTEVYDWLAELSEQPVETWNEPETIKRFWGFSPRAPTAKGDQNMSIGRCGPPGSTKPGRAFYIVDTDNPIMKNKRFFEEARCWVHFRPHDLD